MDVVIAVDEIGFAHQPLVQGNGGFQPVNDVFAERTSKAHQALDQAQELQNLDAPGAFGQFLSLLPGISQIQNYLRPANKIAAFIMNAFIGEAGVRARILTQMFAERESVIFPMLRQNFGVGSLAGEKIPAIRFIGTADE